MSRSGDFVLTAHKPIALSLAAHARTRGKNFDLPQLEQKSNISRTPV
jgi:hypothetical protein